MPGAADEGGSAAGSTRDRDPRPLVPDPTPGVSERRRIGSAPKEIA
jgi:hypothetical protein